MSAFDEPRDDRTIKKEKANTLSVKYGKSTWGDKRLLIDEQKTIKNRFPLPDGHVMGVVVGASGEGKSYITLSLVPQFNNLSQIIVLSKIVGNPIYNAIEAYCQSEHIQYGFSSTPEEGAKMIEAFIYKKPQFSWTLIIFDDFNEGSTYSRENKYNKLQNMSFQMLRNYNCHFLTITQSYTGISTLVRNNMNLLVLFRLKQRRAIDMAALDYENLTGLSVEQFNRIYRKLVLKEKHAYLLTRNDETYIYRPSQGERLMEVEYDESDEDDESDNDE